MVAVSNAKVGDHLHWLSLSLRSAEEQDECKTRFGCGWRPWRC